MVQAPAKPAPTPPGAATLNADLVEAPPITLRLPARWTLDSQRLLELSALNEALWFERTAEGALLISPPPSFLNSHRGGHIFGQIFNWQLADDDDGATLPADGAFELPDSSVLIPDASWVSNKRLSEIDVDDEGVWSVVPDFVLEVRSRSQGIADQKDKLERWMANGVRLGWLLDAFEGEVWVYREGQDEPELLERPDTLSGEDVMAGLTVDLTRVWPASGG